MKIGLTYDLRSAYLAEGYSMEETAEFDRDDTIDAIDSALRTLGYETDRIGHARQLIGRLAGGDRWDLVFNICEGLKGMGREAQVPAILDVYGIPYTFAGPLVMSVCLHKGLTKKVIRDGGQPTARFFVAETEQQLACWRPSFAFPMFVKPVAEGTGKGVTPRSKVTSRKNLLQVGVELLREFRQPILIEQYLSGREFTVGVWGSGDTAEAIGTLEIILLAGSEPDVYSYVNKENCELLVEYRRVDGATDPEVRQAEQLALRAWQLLEGCDAGRIDLRSDANGRPQFIEANPLAGLHPEHSDLPMLCTAHHIDYIELIRRIVESAATRAGLLSRPAFRLAGSEPSSNGAAWSRAMRVAILHQQVQEDSIVSDNDVLKQIDVVRGALSRLGNDVGVIGCSLEVDELPSQLSRMQADVVFNLVESLGGTDRLMAMIPRLLDGHGVPYTGSTTSAILATTNKVAAKRSLQEAGLPTPAWFCPTSASEGILPVSFVPSKSKRLHTTIIKAIWEHASFAIDDESVVVTDGSRTQLKALIRNRQASIGCPCFAEEFIEGREFNLSLIAKEGQPLVLPPAEIEFACFNGTRRHIVGYKAKWQSDSFEYLHTPRRFEFPSRDRLLLNELTELALHCWKLFEVTGYARVDFRVDRAGRPWILEVNANPCLSPDAGFAAALERAEITVEAAIQWILEDALRRSPQSADSLAVG